MLFRSAQASIYSKSNLRRAYSDFDDTDIVGIQLAPEHVIIVRQDGTEQVYDRTPVINAYQAYTSRLKDFFSYLGPNYRGPSIWHNNSYVLFKGWHYSHKLGYLSEAAKLQRTLADKLIHIKDQIKLLTLLQSDQTDMGHLVAPDGFYIPNPTIDFDAPEPELETGTNDSQSYETDPYCSCGSFQRQIKALDQFQEEIKGYKPTCIHLTWMKRYRQLLAKRSDVRSKCRGLVPENAVAWWYAPPEGTSDTGRFLVLYTRQGSTAPLKAWRTYKPKEIFTQYDVWDLFDSMLDNGFVPFPGSALPQLKQAWNQNNQKS